MRRVEAAQLKQGMTVQVGDAVVVTLTRVSVLANTVELRGNSYSEKTGYRTIHWSVGKTQRVAVIAGG